MGDFITLKRKALSLFLILLFLLASAGVHLARAATPFSVTFVRKWGSGGSGDGQFNAAHALGLGKDGKIYVGDEANHRIQYFSSTGAFLGKWGSYGSGNGEIISPASIAVSPDGTKIFVVERDNHRVQYFSPTGGYLGKWGAQGSGDGQFQSPGGISIASDGTVYIADRGNNRIQYFSLSGTYLGKWGTGGSGNGQFNQPIGVAANDNGTVYVADKENHRMQYFNTAGTYLGQWGSSGSGQGTFGYDGPTGINVGLDGNIYVADPGNNLIQVFSANGAFLGQWGGWGDTSSTGKFYYPNNVVIAPGGNVYVGDELNNRIQQFVVDAGNSTPTPTYILTVNIIGNGSVTPTPAAPYHSGDNVELTASPNQGWVFNGWSENCTVQDGKCHLVITANTTVTANFVLAQNCVPVTGLDFDFTPTEVVANQPVLFTANVNTGSGPISYAWDFGDGSSVSPISETIYSHTFPAVNVLRLYPVSLVASNACSSQKVNKDLAVQANLSLNLIYLPVIAE
jgi:sugar lactone lactonase YvrE